MSGRKIEAERIVLRGPEGDEHSLLHASPNDLHRAARGDRISRDVWAHIRSCPECRDDALSLLLLLRRRLSALAH